MQESLKRADRGTAVVFVRSRLTLIALFLLTILSVSASRAQDKPGVLRPPIESQPISITISINEAVETANRRYPSIARSDMDTKLAGHEITVAKTQYLPRMDMLLQEMRATQNVTAGTILPQFLNVIPLQSGPPVGGSSFSSLFNSNAGLNFSWELVDFGKRAANVKLARRGFDQSQATLTLTRLDVQTRAADTYLKLIMAKRQILAFQATLERMKEWAMVVHTLCDKGLRPGVDAFRADAEVSLSKIALIDANKEADLLQQDLAESIGMAGSNVTTVEGPLVTRPKQNLPSPQVLLMPGAGKDDLSKHPLALVRSAQIDVSKARLHLLDRSWYPHLWLEFGIWGRGSGDRRVASPVADGILPRTANWAVGLTVQFPIMDYFKIRAQKGVERSQIQARQAEYDLAMQELIKQDGKARVYLARAQEVAAETPVLVEAARENEIKARERYRVGLTNVVEVAEAERILARAQVEDAVSQVKVWQAILSTAYAHGDLQPFLRLVSLSEQTGPGGKP
ncbi:MAG TPA: TolC family protein [Candidatus Obscuribacter sp.]|nr:TolC family protein [Candidatus Obscuribacter sp.]HMX46265.1 TolC family protein [Candidatus Obscuribacter sp.]